MSFFYWSQIIVEDSANPEQETTYNIALLQMEDAKLDNTLVYLFKVKKECGKDYVDSGLEYPKKVCERVGLLAGVGVIVSQALNTDRSSVGCALL